MTDQFRAFLKKVAEAALTSAVAAGVAAWPAIAIEEPYKTIIALLAVAFYNRFRR